MIFHINKSMAFRSIGKYYDLILSNLRKLFNKSNLLYVILFFQFIYGIAYIFNSSVLINGNRYFILFDDSMISMQYAKTFANGFGLVWFPEAEKVQGYTNFLYTLLMSLIHLFPIPLSKTSLIIQIIGLGFVIISAYVSRKIFLQLTNNTFLSSLLVIVVGFYFPAIYWSTLGMEAGCLMCLTLFILYFLINDKYKQALFFICIGILVRIDFSIIILPYLFKIVISKKLTTSKLVFYSILPFFTLVSLLIFQKIYYNDYLPNTFYLKLGIPFNIRLTRGLITTRNYLNTFEEILLLLGSYLFIISKNISWKNKLLFFLFVFIILTYNTYIGGDAWEWSSTANRFNLLASPIIIIIIFIGLSQLSKIFKFIIIPIKNFFFILLSFTLLLFANFNIGKPIESFHQASPLIEEFFLIKKPLMRYNHDIGKLKAALILNELLEGNNKILVSSAGITPYFMVKGEFIDLLGKSDKYIAKSSPHLDIIPFIPGHSKWDFSYSILNKSPDISIGCWYNSAFYLPKKPIIYIPGDQGIYITKSLLQKENKTVDDIYKIWKKYYDNSIIFKIEEYN